MPVAAESPNRHAVRLSTGPQSMVAARPPPAAPTSFWARPRSIPPMRPCRRASSSCAEAISASPASDAHIAVTSCEIRGSYFRMPVSSGHRAAASALASALWTATWVIFGVKWSVSSPLTSIRAASASPMRRSSHDRSATQSAGFTSRGARAFARSVSRSAMCAQREAIGVSIRRMRVERNTPLAPPQGSSPRPSAAGSSLPTTHGSRLAQPGYSIGGWTGCVGWRLTGLTSSTAVSSPPPERSELEGWVCGWGCAAPIPPFGYWFADCATCWAIAGKAIATTAEATKSSLMRIAPLRNRDLDHMGRLLLRNGRKEIEPAEDDDEHNDEHHKP